MKFIYAQRGKIVALWALFLLWPVGSMQSWAWIAVLALGLFLRVWARSVMGEHSRGNVHAAPRLVQTGPYSLMPHPLYVSNALVAGAGVLISGWPAGVKAVWWLALVAFYSLLARAENRFLQQSFGAEWHQWRRSFSVRKLGGELRRTAWGRALRQDAWTWFWLGLFLMLWYGRTQCFGA
ncbi:MAG: hypothetical protein GX801_01555 [Fibrobacter sp.]|nr:hypothetical protein [Fibrobacter sp.]